MQNILQRLENDRKALLDLSLRNPLLAFRPSKTRGVEVVSEKSAILYNLLVGEDRKFGFKDNGKEEEAANETDAEDALPLPVAEAQKAYTDNKLQTAETALRLQKRLLKTYYDANTSIQEQGVNILFLAFGLLRWYEADSSEEPKRAPLVLVPVALERKTSNEKFTLQYTRAEVESNISLQEKLRADFGIRFPLFSVEEFAGLEAYFDAAEDAVKDKKRWTVARDEIHLGFFSFGKFMLYQDLDAGRWPEDTKPQDHPLMQALLGSGFSDPEPSIGDAVFLDNTAAATNLLQVLDADGTQVQAMLAVDEGRNLVIQGPPGTGKSQTITNLIANAIGKGQRVLFVAEKLAALEVVKRRLDAVGLGDACLELHSHKANKKDVLKELSRVLELGKPTVAALEAEAQQTSQYQRKLNDYCAAVNTPVGNTGLAPFALMGNLHGQRHHPAYAHLKPLSIPAMDTLSSEALRRAADVADRLEAWLRTNGLPSALPFWGSELRIALPADLSAIQMGTARALEAHEKAQQTLSLVASENGISMPENSAEFRRCLALFEMAARAPRLAGLAVENEAWKAMAENIRNALRAGKEAAGIQKSYAEILTPEAWIADYAPVQTALKTHGKKWWRFLIGEHRQALKTLSAWTKGAAPKDYDARLKLVEDLARYRSLLAEAKSAETMMKEVFPLDWRGVQSDWEMLSAQAEFLINAHQSVATGAASRDLFLILQRNTPEAARKGYDDLLRAENERQNTAAALLQKLAYKTPRSIQNGLPFAEWHYAAQRMFLENTQTQVASLPVTASWNTLCDAAKQEGVSFLAEESTHWPEAANSLRQSLLKTYWEHGIQKAFTERLPLRQFDGITHAEVLQKFRKSDPLTQRYHRAKAALAHFTQLPPRNGSGQVATLAQEFNKKARHKPIRKLIAEAGTAIQAIKPVFMMSPLSVANYLAPGALSFDLVIFDEASQVKPVDAFGAILRGRQLVVVGDTKQLPPTSFFDKLLADEDENHDEEEGAFATSDVPSILGLCNAQRAPERMLRWHYRSRHESLITVSNHEFYDNRLVVFPSPDADVTGLGLAYHYLPDTAYDRGKSRANRKEAEAVADAVIAHATQTPGKSLGVVAFSEAQKNALMDALELRRREQPHLEPFFSTAAAEPFFIKNLESVQGDERDVILISVGYGKDGGGYTAMNFGPLGAEGGEKRLNVLITRAKERCEVFTNLRPDDIDLNRAKGLGVKALKTFLKYAATRILDVPQATGREADSPFEEAVCAQLQSMGYTVDKQVGSNGFFIDLAVVDDTQPGRYVIGIECDGASYHSARSARDRDRLRQAALESMGWTFHRIWSTDWFRHPDRELKRLAEAIERAKVSGPLPKATVAPEPATGVERKEAETLQASAVPKYVLAKLPASVANTQIPFHEQPRKKVADWLETVVRIESPVHLEEAARRLAEAAGISRVGSRVMAAVQAAAILAEDAGHIQRQGDFLWHVSMQTPVVRDRSALPAASRKMSLIAPEEIGEALLSVTRQASAITEEVLVADCGRMLGFARVTADMRESVSQVLAQMLAGERLVKKGDWIRVAG